MKNRNIFRHVCNPFTLEKAWQRVAANHGSAGGDGVSIADFARHLGRNLRILSNELRSHSFHPGPCRKVEIPKRKGGTRRLMIPPIRDRVVHTAIARTLQPYLEPQFEDSSFAYRPGRSVKQAVARIEHWRDQGYCHVIDTDIVSYFDAVRHDLLLEKLALMINRLDGAKDLLALIGGCLDAQGQELESPGRGLVQGSPLSPILANLYLDALDESLHRRGVRIVRYADDFVILCKKHDQAEKALENTRRVLADHGLELHEDTVRIVDFNRGFDFVGHLFARALAVEKTYEDDLGGFEDPSEHSEEAAGIAVHAGPRFDRGGAVMYLTQPGHKLRMRNNSFSVCTETDHEIAAVAQLRVERIEVGPRVDIDEAVIDTCVSSDTALVFVDGHGAIRARLERPGTERAGLQMAQAQTIDNTPLRLHLARKLVEARIRNQRTQLFRLNRSHDDEKVRHTLKAMQRNLRKLPGAESIDQLRGIEGASAAMYWPALGQLTRGAPNPLRRTRPAADPINAVINYLTYMLERDIHAAILAAGLHTGFGLLHNARDRSDAAVYDLMEPFRAPLSEGLASFLFNARRLRPEMFAAIPDGGTRISQEARHVIIRGYEASVAKRVNITGRTGKLAWRPMMERQARDLARAIRKSDLGLFQPYLMEA